MRPALALLMRWGPPVRCQRCGGILFRGIAYVSRGQLKLVGVEDVLVRVDFETTSRLGLRHADLSQCAAVERPAR